MSLEGLRAWVAEVERKLGKRTRVFVVLSVIAIGVAAAAVYLAIDARNSSVSESDVQALQEKLEERIDELSGAAVAPPAEVEPEPEPDPAPEPAPPQKSEPRSGGNSGGGGTGDGASGTTPGGASGTAPGGAAGNAQLQELLQKAKERAEESEQAR